MHKKNLVAKATKFGDGGKESCRRWKINMVDNEKKFFGKINEFFWGDVRGLRGKVRWGRGQETVEGDETNAAIRSTRDHRGPKNNDL